VLQIVMGWEDCHLHKFVIGKSYYSSPPAGLDDDEFYLIAERGKDFTLGKVVPVEKTKFLYQYDLGDNWEHQILVERILPLEPGQHYPTCFSGKRACPPEDVGGIWGYADFLDGINNPDHPAHVDWREQFEDGFDPEAFDLDAVNADLRKYIK
ncbi:MAG: plasmid pRiA4b ORF-3 family protein, partial [Deltaproteobacteria bacterium]|nr:plasmid pRiA4b ORF-3 family protein [Deltaproteobacteria bacterium]